MTLLKIAPYMKSVVAATIALLTLVAQVISDGTFDTNEIVTIIGGIASVIGVYKATNAPHPNDTGTVG